MFTNYRKETSERSDRYNWAKNQLIEKTPYHFDSIEGCNESVNNRVTHLFERARIDFDGTNSNENEVHSAIIALEGEKTLLRKINFAHTFGIPLSYVLYNLEYDKVWLYEFSALEEVHFIRIFSSIKKFSEWIKDIKGWTSSKAYREESDLPEFDIRMRQYGTPWPTNIDCFVSNEMNQPIGIIEFQNADKIHVRNHSNNRYFHCYYINSNDLRRWESQEILRVQSGLRLFIITWAKYENDYTIKEISKVVFPCDTKYESLCLLQKYTRAKTKEEKRPIFDKINNTFSTYEFYKEDSTLLIERHDPPLNYKWDNTFPLIYYSHKQFVENQKDTLHKTFMDLIEK